MVKFLKLIWYAEIIRRTRAYFWHVVSGIYNRAGDDHVFLLAGGLSFSLLICIVPITLIIFSVIGMLLEKRSVEVEIGIFIDNIIPYEAYATHVKNVIITRIDEFKGYKTLAGYLGFFGLLFAASGLFSSMRTILNNAYRVTTNRSIWMGKLKDVGLVFGVVLYFLLSATLLPALSIFERFAEESEFLSEIWLAPLPDFLLQAISFVIIFVAFFLLYTLVPQKRIPKSARTVSAVSATILWKIAEILFGYYVTEIATLKRIYGAASITIVVVFWIYYTSIVFIIAAEVGQLHREWKDKRASLQTRAD